MAAMYVSLSRHGLIQWQLKADIKHESACVCFAGGTGLIKRIIMHVLPCVSMCMGLNYVAWISSMIKLL